MIDYNMVSEIVCIKQMEDNEKESFEAVFNHYGKKLSDRIVSDDGVFTPHGILHCLSIYKIISNIILRKDTPYLKEGGLTRRELFVLNLSVLFHDISMSDTIRIERENHSRASAEYVEKEYENARSVLKSETDLSKNECKALKAVIKAHSDLKGKYGVPKEENGLYARDLEKTYEDLMGNKIRVLFLAGVLRLADELDVTSDRIGNGKIETEIDEEKNRIKKDLKKNDEKLKSEWDKLDESGEHWERLHLFERVTLDSSKKRICLIVDDEHVKRKCDAAETYTAISKDIIEVHSKANNEFVSIKKKAFSESDVSIYVYNLEAPISIVTKENELNDEIQKAQARMALDEKDEEKEDDNQSHRKKLENSKCKQEFIPKVIDKDLEIEISEEINKRQLLEFGHFLLNDKYCARDWINVRELVETMKISKKMVNTIIKHINTRGVNNVIILGMDMVGALLASRVAFLLQYPMSYCVSLKNRDFNSSDELIIEVKEDYKVIIITESIVTFLTMKETIKSYKLEDKIDSIYTVFFRRPSLEIQDSQSISYTVYSLNNDYPIEIVEKDNCYYKEGECFAKNRH